MAKTIVDFIEKIPKFIRWILFLPCALLGWVITGTLLYSTNYISALSGGYLTKLTCLAIGDFVAAASFVYIGSVIVPKRNIFTVILLASCILLIEVGCFIFRFIFRMEISVSMLYLIVELVAAISGIVFGVQATLMRSKNIS